jgi:hypothetical protein
MTSDPDQIREQIEETRISRHGEPACRKAQGSQRTFRRARSKGQGQRCSVTVRLQHDFRGGRKGIGGPRKGVSGSRPPSPPGGG